MPVETAMERLRRLAGLPANGDFDDVESGSSTTAVLRPRAREAQDATSVAKKPIFKPHVNALPDLPAQTDREQTIELGRRNDAVRRRAGYALDNTTTPTQEHAVPSRPSQIVSASSDPFAAGRAAQDAGGKQVARPRKKITLPGISSRDAFTGGDEANADELEGTSEIAGRKAAYEPDAMKKSQLLSVGAHLGREADFVRKRGSPLAAGAMEAANSATVGLTGRIDGRYDWEKERAARVAAGTNVTPQELRDAGLIGEDDLSPRLIGNERTGELMHGDLNPRQLSEQLGGLAGFAVPIGVENKLIGDFLGKAAPRAVRAAEEAKGLSRVDKFAENITGPRARRAAFDSPRTMTGKVAKSAGEFALPGAAMDANRAAQSGENPGDAIAEGLVLNAGMGAAFPFVGKGLSKLRDLAHDVGVFATQGRVTEPSIDLAPPTVPTPIGDVVRPGMAKLKELAGTRVGKAAMIGGGLAAAAKYGAPAEASDEDKAANKTRMQNLLGMGVFATGTLVSHGHEELGHVWEHKGWKIQKNAHDKFDIYNQDNIHIATFPTFGAAKKATEPSSTKGSMLHMPEWDYEAAAKAGNISSDEYKVLKAGWKFESAPDGVTQIISPHGQVIGIKNTLGAAMKDVITSAPLSPETKWMIKASGGLNDLHDEKGKYIKSFAAWDEAEAYAKKQGKEVLPAPENKRVPSPRAKMGLLGRTVKEQVLRYAQAGMQPAAKNLQRFMKGAAVQTPLVHATKADFDTFKHGELGFHLTTDPAAAEKRLPWFSKSSSVGSMMPLWAAIKNPVRLTDPGTWSASILHELHEKGVITADEMKETADEVLANMLHPGDQRPSLDQSHGARSYRWTKPIRDLLKSKGYDGIVYDNPFEGGGDSYIAFDPEQLKSVTGNNGNFDPKIAAVVGGGALAARLLTKEDGPPSEDEKKHAQLLQGLALAMGTIASHGRLEEGPGLAHALEGRLHDLTTQFRELHETVGPHAQEALERVVSEERAKLEGARAYETELPKAKNRASNKPKVRPLVALREAGFGRYANTLEQMKKEYAERSAELVAKARDLKARLEEAKDALPPEDIGMAKKGAIVVGATGAALAANKSDDKRLPTAVLAAGALAITHGRGEHPLAEELARVTRERTAVAERLKAFHGERVPRTPEELTTAAGWSKEGKALQKRQAELEAQIKADTPEAPKARKLKPSDAPIFFSRADKFFDEGGLDKYIAHRPAGMRGKEPKTAAEWRDMLLGEKLPNVSRQELEIRLGEQLDLAEEDGRELTRADIRGMLADNPVKIQVHVLGKPIAGSENIDDAGKQLENAANYDQSNGDFSESPFEDWTFRGGDDYRTLAITAEPTKRYKPDNNPKKAYDVVLEHNEDRNSWSVVDPETGELLKHPDGKQMFDVSSKAEATRRAQEALHASGWKGDRVNVAAISEGDPMPAVSGKAKADLIIKRSPDLEGYDVYYPNGEKLPDHVSGAEKEDARYYARKWWHEQGHQGSPVFGDEKGMVSVVRYDEPHFGKSSNWIAGAAGGWDNVIAHLRITTRMVDGKKTLHIEEAQSTLGQDIAKFGADGSPERKAKIKSTKARIKEIPDEIKALMREGGGEAGSGKNLERKALSRQIKALADKISTTTDVRRRGELTIERDALIKQRGGMPLEAQGEQHAAVQKLQAEQRKLQALLGELNEKQQNRNTPALPLTEGVGEYTDTLLRTALDIAAREGHEKIVWTGGADQTLRFDSGLQKIADKIEYDPKTRIVRTEFKGKVVDGVPTSMNAQELRAHFGNTIAEKLLGGETVEGKEVSIGKKGMVNYYDNIIPTWFAKEARSHGIEVELKDHKIEDARRETDVGAEDLTIGHLDHPLDPSADELEYWLDQARHEGVAPSALRVGRNVLFEMRRSGADFQSAVHLKTPEQRQMLADAIGYDTYSPSGKTGDRSVNLQGFDVPPELVQKIMHGQQLYSNPMFDPKLLVALAKAHPSLFHGAALAGLGYGTQQVGEATDDEKLKWSGMGIMALGALHAVAAHPMKGGKKFGVAALEHVGAKVRDGIKDEKFGNLKGSDLLNWISHDILATPELKAAANEYEHGVAKGAARAAEYQAKMRRLGPVGERLAADLIDQEAWEKQAASLTPDEKKSVLAAAQALMNEFHDIGQEEVNLGTMEQGQFDKYDGQYIPRLFATHEADAARGVGNGPQATNKPKLQKHQTRDMTLPRNVRENMGQIRETGYLAQKGIAKGYRNIAAAKLFSALSSMPGVLSPDYQTAVQDLLNATKSGNAKTIRLAKQALDAVRGREAGGYGEYKTLSTSKGYGVLAGAVVRKDVAAYLEGLPHFGDKSLANNLFQSWKKIHTVFNPGTHVGNFVSNITTVHMKGLPIHEIPAALDKAGRAIKAYDRDVRDLAEAGVMDNNIATMDYTGNMLPSPRSKVEGLRDLADRTTPVTKSILAQREIEPHGKLSLAARKATQKAEKYYNLEDNWFRVALYKKVISAESKGGMGLTRAQGIEYVRYHMGDFRTRSKALAMARWYSPFVMYPAKMLPHMVGSVVEHPWRWLTLAAGWGAVDQLSAYSQGQGALPSIDDEGVHLGDVKRRIKTGGIDPMDMKEDERPSRGFGYLIPGPIQAPFSRGKAKFAEDISRWTPFSALSGQPSPGSMAAAVNSRIPAIVSPGGPLGDLFARTQVNKDPYTGEDWIHEGESPATKAGKVAMGLVGNQVLPSALAWHAPRMIHDVLDKSYDKASIDALGFAGMRPRTIIPGQRLQQDKYWLQDENEAAARELKKRRRETKDPDRLKQALQEFRDRKARVAAEFKRRNTRPR